MGQRRNSQLELFSDMRRQGAVSRRQSSFFAAMRGYEKRVFLVIFFIITAIIAFSLGVEKGKSSTQNPEVARKIEEEPVLESTPKQGKPAQSQMAPVQPAPALTGSLQRYTVQIASYKNAKYAQQEAESLRKKGFVTTVASKGEYFVLYVGNFPGKEQAHSFLSEIKKEKRYAGAILRRL